MSGMRNGTPTPGSTTPRPRSGWRSGWQTSLLLAATLALSGCIATVAAVAQAGAQLATAYLVAHPPEQTVVTPECTGKIRPILLDDDYLTRLTAAELDQIDVQAVELEERCPGILEDLEGTQQE